MQLARVAIFFFCGRIDSLRALLNRWFNFHFASQLRVLSSSFIIVAIKLFSLIIFTVYEHATRCHHRRSRWCLYCCCWRSIVSLEHSLERQATKMTVANNDEFLNLWWEMFFCLPREIVKVSDDTYRYSIHKSKTFQQCFSLKLFQFTIKTIKLYF